MTVKDYKGVVDRYLLAEFGEHRLREITSAEINAYKERLLEEGRLSNRTIVRHLVVLHGIFKRAQVEPNPAAGGVGEVLMRRYFEGEGMFPASAKLRAMLDLRRLGWIIVRSGCVALLAVFGIWAGTHRITASDGR